MGGVLVPVTAPTSLPVSSAEAAEHLRLDDPQLGELDLLIGAATNYLDGRDGVLGRALMLQTWDLKLAGFPMCGSRYDYEHGAGYYMPIKIPLPPLRSVTYVKYFDTGGVEQTWSSGQYVVDLGRGEIIPALGVSYPASQLIRSAVTVRFVAGYPAGQLPAADKLLVLWLTAHWHEHREPVVVGSLPAEVPEHLDRMINARRLLQVA